MLQITVKYLVLAVQFLLVTGSINGQELAADTSTSVPGVWDLIEEDVIVVADDGIAFITSPVEFDEGDWLFAGLTLGTTLYCITQDAELRRIRLRNKSVSPVMRTMLDGATAYGNVFDAGVLFGMVYLTGLVTDSYFKNWPLKKGTLRNIARVVGESLFFAGGIASIMRSTLGRKRPYYYPPGKEDVWDFDFMNFKTSQNAFPSGHAVVSFAISTSLAEYLDSWVARAVLYPIAGLGLWARVVSDGHWSSDIVFGAALGVATGLFVVTQEKNRSVPPSYGSTSSSTRTFFVYPCSQGFGVALRF